jgi:hypothetical protein
MTPDERTPKYLADKLEELLEEESAVDFGAESKAEAVQLAWELNARGWNAKIGTALMFPKDGGPAHLLDLVTVQGRKP